MSKVVKVTLTTIGADAGPFSIYQDSDSYSAPVATGLSKTVMAAGYNVTLNSAATMVKVVSTGVCNTYEYIPISNTTTSTTTSTSTSTSTTTSTSSTTTTTTSSAPEWYQFTDCFNGDVKYSQQYPGNTFNVNDTVTRPGTADTNVYRITAVYTTDPTPTPIPPTTIPPDTYNLVINAALNPNTSAQLTGCPVLVEISLEPGYYGDLPTPGYYVRGEFTNPAVGVGGPALGFTGQVSIYALNGCPGTATAVYNFNPGGTNAITLENPGYTTQLSCSPVFATEDGSLSKCKITKFSVLTGAVTSRDGSDCPNDYSTATTIILNAMSNNYPSVPSYRFRIFSGSQYIYYQITGCFNCPF
jgi:hypothetical protein